MQRDPPIQEPLPLTEGTPSCERRRNAIVGEAGEFGASFEPFRVMEPAEQSPAAEVPAESAPDGVAESGPDDGPESEGESDLVWV